MTRKSTTALPGDASPPRSALARGSRCLAGMDRGNVISTVPAVDCNWKSPAAIAGAVPVI